MQRLGWLQRRGRRRQFADTRGTAHEDSQIVYDESLRTKLLNASSIHQAVVGTFSAHPQQHAISVFARPACDPKALAILTKSSSGAAAPAFWSRNSVSACRPPVVESGFRRLFLATFHAD